MINWSIKVFFLFIYKKKIRKIVVIAWHCQKGCLEQRRIPGCHYTVSVFYAIRHVRYINILTWLRGFQVKLLYLVLFSFLCVSFGNWETKETWKICNFDPKASEPCLNIDISNVANWSLITQSPSYIHRGRVVRKPGNVNPGLNVNWSITFCYLKLLFTSNV